MPVRPLIGITPYSTDEITPLGTLRLYGNTDGYFEAVARAGGTPLMIPLVDGLVDEYLDLADGFILTGSGDIEPSVYGDEDGHNTIWGVDNRRDDLELTLLEGALQRKIPTLGICRGIQIINVGLGGSLYQDIPDQFASNVQHQQHLDGIRKEDPGHSVHLLPDSRLAEMFDGVEIDVNSFHHQGIRRLSNRIKATALAADGLVEGVELPGHPFLVGVQWHPEMMFDEHPEQLVLFQSLIEASRVAQVLPVR